MYLRFCRLQTEIR